MTESEMKECSLNINAWSHLGWDSNETKSLQCQDTEQESNPISCLLIGRFSASKVGPTPRKSYNDWVEHRARSAHPEDGHPEIIEKTISPITELFTEDFMGHLIDVVDYNGMKPWLEEKLLDYCLIFGSHII